MASTSSTSTDKNSKLLKHSARAKQLLSLLLAKLLRNLTPLDIGSKPDSSWILCKGSIVSQYIKKIKDRTETKRGGHSL